MEQHLSGIEKKRHEAPRRPPVPPPEPKKLSLNLP